MHKNRKNVEITFFLFFLCLFYLLDQSEHDLALNDLLNLEYKIIDEQFVPEE